MAGLIKSNVQLGDSSTATQNFTLTVPSTPDGTVKLARGNAGATTQDILTVDANGKVAFPQNSVPMFIGTFGTSGIGTGNVPLSLTPVTNSGVTVGGSGQYIPTVAGWYHCDLFVSLNVPSQTAGGCAIVASTGSANQVQPPYSGNYSFASASLLVYCNGTTDYVQFCSYSAVAGGSLVSARGSLVLVKAA